MSPGGLRIATVALAAAAAGLAWLCLDLATAAIPPDEIAPAADWSPGLAPLDFASSPGDQGTPDPVTLDRLVFSPTRRLPELRPPAPQAEAPEPQDAPPPETQANAAPPESLILEGIYISEARRQALIKSPAHPDSAWIAAGGETDGWHIERIDAGGVALESGTRSIALTLYVDNLGK